MKGFKKDGKFRPTGNKQKSSLTKEKLKHKTNNPIHEMKKAYKQHIDKKKKEKTEKLKGDKLLEANAEKHDVSVPVVKLIQKLEGDNVLIKKLESGNSARNNSQYITLSNGATYNLYDDYDDMYDEAKERIENDLENEPYVFPENILANFIEMDQYSKHSYADSEAEHYRDEFKRELRDEAEGEAEDLADEELSKDDSDHKGKPYTQRQLADKVDELTPDILDNLVEKEIEKKYDEINGELDDPIQYFVHDQGMYDVQELLKQGFVQIDYDKAVRELISDWGIGRYLSGYDEQTHETSDGKYLVKHND